jgi:hypothetical protein
MGVRLARGCVICLCCDGVIYGHFFFFHFLSISKTFLLAMPMSFTRALFSEDEGVDSRSDEDEDEDESSIKAVKCRWKGCGAVLQSKAHGLGHMQVAHVREVVIGICFCQAIGSG